MAALLIDFVKKSELGEQEMLTFVAHSVMSGVFN